MYKLDLEKAKEPEIKLPTSAGSWKKQENSRKTYTSASLTTRKHLTVWITKNCEKFWNRWEYQNTTLPASYKTCMQVKKQQLEADMEQWTGSKLGKDYIKALDCHSAYLSAEYLMWNAGLDEAQAGIKIGGRNNLRYADDTTLMAESEEELKSLLMKVKEESGKSWLKTQYSKN